MVASILLCLLGTLDLGFTFGDGVKKFSARVLTEKAKDRNMSYFSYMRK